MSAIHSLAFSDKEDLLAVGLSDGSIQLLCASKETLIVDALIY